MPKTPAGPAYRFDDQDRSIAILRPELPAPWINYLSNGQMHAFVSQAGAGLAWWRSPVLFRLNRYRHYAPQEGSGFYIYIREENGSYWSPSFQPSLEKPDQWQAQHYPGRSVFSASKGSLSAKLTLFICPDHDTLVWDLKVENHADRAAKLDVFAYSELGLMEWLQEASWGYYIQLMLETRFDEATQSLQYLYHHQNHPRLADLPLVYMASDKPVASYSGSRDAFLGPGRNETRPQAVEDGVCDNKGLDAGQGALALHVKLDLAAGASDRARFFVGAEAGALKDYKASKDKVARSLKALRAPGAVDAQADKLGAWWQEHFDALQFQLPDADVQRQVNTWGPIQCVQTGRYSRSISTVAPGIRGLGFRDTCQDMLAIAYRRPDWALKNLRILLANQYEDGHAVHTAFPEEKQAPVTSIHSDDHLWLHLLAHALLAETGDAAFLKEEISFLGPDHKTGKAKASAWQHLMAALRFTASHLGAHGIPLTLHSDWNDIIGRFAREGRGESTFAALQYVRSLRLMIEMAAATDEAEDQRWLEGALAQQVAALAACAWDGAWWRRGFDDQGHAIGSEASDFGKIWINPQSWAVLAGIGSVEQQSTALSSAKAKLATGLGLMKLSPGFKTYPEVSDPFSGYGPGCGENGAIFCHANTWIIIAEALLGHGAQAWDYYRQLLPHLALQKVGLERYQAEPYAYASNIVGPENARFGWANVSQVTGTAPWMDVAVTQYLLGLRPELGALRFDPCLPADWKGFTAQRRYRGVALDVVVENPKGVEKGVKELWLDGKAMDLSQGALIMAESLKGKSKASVRAVMG